MTNTAVLTDPLSSEMLNFEKNIAYFFGVENPNKVAHHYIQAVKEIERLGTGADDHTLGIYLMPHLRSAYQEIKEQKQLQFNIEKAAELEFKLFLGDIRNSTFEDNYQVLVQLYETVFQTKSDKILKSAMLRAFLFKYKFTIFETTKQLTPSDQDILLKLAKASESEMMSLENELACSMR
ncbi:hypothetical protein [Legionella gresilensis]|uniref:hypothetical protein n=1 Tax=Legionella gresilensis TaxID=91823 RepID=UPI001041884F|nr:hypothetical protein [Legionella gresilensis]